MYNDHLSTNKYRATSSRELAMLAREQEKEMALLAGMYKAQANPGANKTTSRIKLLLTGLFTGI
jgi:hypothetical protein